MSNTHSIRIGWALMLAGFWTTADATPSVAPMPVVHAAPVTADLPRYQLEVGQELVFRGSSLDEYGYESGDQRRERATSVEMTWRVWVIRRNEDESWHLLLKSEQAVTQSLVYRKPNSDDSLLIHAKGGPRVTVTWGWCDLHSDGRFAQNETLGFLLDPAVVLPALPANEDALATSWSVATHDGGETSYTALPDESNNQHLVFEQTDETPLDVIGGFDRRRVIRFDRERGVPVRMEDAWSHGYGFVGNATGELELADTIEHEPYEMARVDRELDVFFATKRAYDERLDAARTETEHAEVHLGAAQAALRDTLARLDLPKSRAALQALLDKHERQLESKLQDIEDLATLVGKPSPSWETTALGTDEAHSLEGHRGKVLLLDFWYRGCSWCIRAMPQIQEVATHYADHPVRVLGMNTDQVEEDALFVMEKMGLTYPTLRAEGIPEQYRVQGYPTLIVIDPQGVVRKVHAGYSPTLRDELIEIIDELLGVDTVQPSIEPATLKAADWYANPRVWITFVDGEALGFSTGTVVRPGEHQVRITHEYLFDDPPPQLPRGTSMLTDGQAVIWRTVQLDLAAEAGHTYLVNAVSFVDPLTSTGFDMWYWIEDDATKEVVAGQRPPSKHEFQRLRSK